MEVQLGAGVDEELGDVDALRYQRPRVLTDAAALPELLMLKLRYKPVDAAAMQGTSRRVVVHVPVGSVPFGQASETTRFSAAVAAFGMVLRGSQHRGDVDLTWIVATRRHRKATRPPRLPLTVCRDRGAGAAHLGTRSD